MKSWRVLTIIGGWEIGTGPSVVVVDTGMAKTLTTTTLRKGVYAFAFGQRGLMGGLGSRDRRSQKFIRDLTDDEFAFPEMSSLAVKQENTSTNTQLQNDNTMNRSTLISRFVYQFLLATILLPASIVLAGTETYDYKAAPAPPPQPWCVPPPDTEFRIGIPGWITGLSGDFGVKGVVTEQDVKFTDILKRLDMIAVGSLYARYHRWEISADGQYMKLSDTADLRGFLFERANVALKSALAEWFVGYRVINCEKGFLSFSAGGRYNYMSGDLHLVKGSLPILGSRRFSGETDWVDPVIGTNGKVHIWKPVSLWAKGDIGGFGAASDFTWQVQGGLEFQVTRWMWSDVGWRYMKYDYTSGGFTNKTELNGPYMETGINF